MAIEFASSSADEPLLSTINTTPLVDVMLVLLIIFLITIPVVNSSLAVRLPQENAQASEPQTQNVLISVDASGALYWFDTRLPNPAALSGLLAKAALLQPQPEVQIRADARAQYAAVGLVVDACQAAGLQRVGFLTEPQRR